jgi:hypothetical protein
VTIGNQKTLSWPVGPSCRAESGQAGAIPDRYVVLLTPEHLTEEKVEATQPSEKQTEAGLKP